ncbi:hypothetical protein ACMD2_07029 [Ananas comosus]|uniref:HMA domain-containing protein n=1 Tax=Ananas comosus TaxID=4615 RepID=A0A199VIY8_ANACO|nr:hypothetical protein ACMD2_07029 [Ananas comosus]
MGEGEKKEVVVEKKKEEVITIVYRLHIHCDECARVVERHITQHEGDVLIQFRNFVINLTGVRKVEIDSAKGLVTVRGVGIDVTKLKERIERKTRKKIELLSPLPKKEEKKEEKKVEKKEEKKVVGVPSVCTRNNLDLAPSLLLSRKTHQICSFCAALTKNRDQDHKCEGLHALRTMRVLHQRAATKAQRHEITRNATDIYTVKTNREKHICTITGVIEEKKLIEYIRATTRKHGEIIKEEKKVVKEEEKVKVEAKVGKDGVKVEITEKKEKEEIKSKDVVVPYFIPCTHPTFMNFSHPDFFNHKYPPFHYVDYSHLDIKSYQYPPFVHCSHPPECFSEENPYACSVMNQDRSCKQGRQRKTPMQGAIDYGANISNQCHFMFQNVKETTIILDFRGPI